MNKYKLLGQMDFTEKLLNIELTTKAAGAWISFPCCTISSSYHESIVLSEFITIRHTCLSANPPF